MNQKSSLREVPQFVSEVLTANSTPTLLDEMTVEDILQACTQDRSRIDEVNRLLEIFKHTEHFDAPFREFWTNFRAAVQTIDTGKNL